MNRAVDWTIKAAAAVAGFIAGLYGGWTDGTRVLVILMLVDYVLGCACALTGHSAKTVTGHFLSKVAFMGILKKGVIMLVILVAVQLDKAVGSGTGTMFRSVCEFFYIANEGLSIIENAGLLGVPIPKALRKALEALRDKNDKGGGDDDGGAADVFGEDEPIPFDEYDEMEPEDDVETDDAEEPEEYEEDDEDEDELVGEG